MLAGAAFRADEDAVEMCRWLTYAGPPVSLDRLLLEPDNALIRQGLASKLGRHLTNGDGFGAWPFMRNGEIGGSLAPAVAA